MAERGAVGRFIRRYIVYPVQGAAIWAGYLVGRAMSIEAASAVGSALFRFIGPRLRVDALARRNLRRAMPDLSDAEVDRVIRGMWDNLGRGAGECAHLDRIMTPGDHGRVEVIGAENLAGLREDGLPGILFSAHMANWEIACIATTYFDVPVGQIYRVAENPFIERLFQKMRSCISGKRIRKGRDGAREALLLMREGGHLALLVDQKMNEGMAVPFFGRDAMTPTAPARLALRFRCPVVPVRVERQPDVRFRITFFPPLDLPDTGDGDGDTRLLLTAINRIIEGWVRERPEQWFWVHRRWPD